MSLVLGYASTTAGCRSRTATQRARNCGAHTSSAACHRKHSPEESWNARLTFHANERNLGLAANAKRARELSSGEYFRWPAAHDVCAPHVLPSRRRFLD